MPKAIVRSFGHAKRKSIADVEKDKAMMPPPGAYTTISDFSYYGPSHQQVSRNSKHESILSLNRKSLGNVGGDLK